MLQPLPTIHFPSPVSLKVHLPHTPHPPSRHLPPIEPGKLVAPRTPRHRVQLAEPVQPVEALLLTPAAPPPQAVQERRPADQQRRHAAADADAYRGHAGEA